MPGTENPRGSCYKRPAVGDASGAQSSDNNSCNGHFCHLSTNGFQTFTRFLCEFAVCDVLTAEITMRRAQSPNTWQKRQYRAGILGRQNAVRKVTQKSESLSDVSFVDNSWFSCEICVFHFCCMIA